LDYVEEIIYSFSSEHTKEITADEFVSMMLTCVSRTIPECDEEAKLYIENHLITPEDEPELGIGTIQSIEELDA
jgi:hypothetical protein